MPNYTYDCSVCNVQFGIFIPLKELDQPIECINPKCDGILHRVMTAPPFRI